MPKLIDKKYISESDILFELWEYRDGKIELSIELPNPKAGIWKNDITEISLNKLEMRELADFINKHLPKDSP